MNHKNKNRTNGGIKIITNNFGNATSTVTTATSHTGSSNMISNRSNNFSSLSRSIPTNSSRNNSYGSSCSSSCDNDDKTNVTVTLLQRSVVTSAEESATIKMKI